MSTNDEGKLHEQRNLGAAADAELKIVASAFISLKNGYFDAWMKSDPRDVAGREKLWVATTIVTQIEAQLRKAVSDGVVADKEIERKKRATEITAVGKSKKLFDVRNIFS